MDEVSDLGLKTGLILAPPDPRDALAGDFMSVETLSASVDDIEEYELERLPKYPYQNGFPSCVAQTMATWIAYANRKEGVADFMTGRYLYAHCKAIDGYPALEGTFTKTGLKVAIEIGTVIDELYPEKHDITYEEYIELPPESLKNDASPYRMKSYVGFENDTQIKQQIVMNQLPVIVGINSNNTGWGNAVVKVNNYVLQEPTGGRYGHQVLVTGWNKDGWIFENWWGKSWGNDGRATVPYDYSGIWNRMYVPCDLPNYWKEINDMWNKLATIEAAWKWLEELGHPPINDVDRGIHMKAKSPEEFYRGLLSYVKQWKSDNGID